MPVSADLAVPQIKDFDKVVVRRQSNAGGSQGGQLKGKLGKIFQ